MTRLNIASGQPYEAIFGYSRAVRVGEHIHVAGTTAPGSDAYVQAKAALAIVARALADAGAAPEHVVRTVVYVTNMAYADQVARAHGEMFAEIRPVSTLVAVSALFRPELLVEIEAYAILPDKA